MIELLVPLGIILPILAIANIIAVIPTRDLMRLNIITFEMDQYYKAVGTIIV